jgi:hypothetical protein
MTIAQAHQEFKARLDKIDSLEYPNFLTEEVDLILNQAQDRVVKQRYGKSNTKRTSFEEEQKRTEDLKNLIKTIRAIPTIATSSNVSMSCYTVPLQSDHFIIVWESAIINCTTCNSTVVIPGSITRTETIEGIEVEVRPISHNEYSIIRKDPFKGPDHDKILRLMYDGKVELIQASDCTVLYYLYRYIKIPRRVSLDSNITFELSEHMHSEIIDEAVKIALEGIEAKRNQTFIPIVDSQKE